MLRQFQVQKAETTWLPKGEVRLERDDDDDDKSDGDAGAAEGSELAVQRADQRKRAGRWNEPRVVLIRPTQDYHDVNRTYNDIAQALAQYSTLSVRTEVYSKCFPLIEDAPMRP